MQTNQLIWRGDDDVAYIFALFDRETYYLAIRWVGSFELAVELRTFGKARIVYGYPGERSYIDGW